MVLRRLTDNEPPDDSDQNENASDNEPQLFSVGRAVSMAGLLERIEDEFNAETESRPDLIDTEESRRDMVREVVDYVLAVESIKLSAAERRAVIDSAYADLFSAGPIGSFLNDDSVTEIKITGPDRIYVRHGSGDMRETDTRFEDITQLERFTARSLALTGGELTENDPLLEASARFGKRSGRLTATGAPLSAILHVDLRLHPTTPLTLDDLIVRRMLNLQAAQLLRQIVSAGYGLMIAGEAGSGKTTLIQALLPDLPGKEIFAVERAAELRLPSESQRLTAIPPSSRQGGVEFKEQISKAVEKSPDWLILDEVRFDESAAVWNALTADYARSDGGKGARCLWAFRGATDPLRLRTAFGMAVRRTIQAIGQEVIHSALVDKLPFVALTARQGGIIRLLKIGEWQPDGPDLSMISLRELWPNSTVAPRHAL